MKRMMAGVVLGLGMSGLAQAQNSYHWPAPATTAQAAEAAYFPIGTPLTLRTRTQVSTKTNKPGDRLYLEVAETLYYHGQAVIPAGSVAVGEVARADRNGHVGRKGKLDVNLLYVETPSGPIRLTGGSSDEGTSGLITSVATMALVSPLGFFVHGTSAHLPYGTPIVAALAEPMRFYPQSVQQEALNVVQPDGVRALPARFDPSVFGGAGPHAARR